MRAYELTLTAQMLEFDINIKHCKFRIRYLYAGLAILFSITDLLTH